MTSMVIVGALVLSVITIAFVLYPVFRARAVGRRHITYSATGDRLADLIAQRDAIYEAIRDVDFDKETGKLTEEDYRLMRERLTAEGVRLLQELDRLMQADVREELEREIEREVAALRRRRLAESAERRPTRRQAPKPAPGLKTAAVDGKSITCHSCGGRVRAGDRFCSRCGGQLSSGGQATEAIPADSLD